MQVKIKLFHKDAEVPRQATQFAAGWDVVCTEIVKPWFEGDTIICKLGFGLHIPDGYKVMFAPRSSITNTHLILQNSPCIGDSDFRKEYQLRFKQIPFIDKYGCFYYKEFPYQLGERIGQLWIEKIIPIEFEVVDEIEETGRGSYGSTGTR